MLIAQREPEVRITATTAPPPLTTQPVSTDFGQKDWSLSIGICALVGMKVWELIKRYRQDDSDLNRTLVKGLMEERKILLQAILEKKP